MYVLSIHVNIDTHNNIDVNIHMNIYMIMKNTYLNAYIITHTNIIYVCFGYG